MGWIIIYALGLFETAETVTIFHGWERAVVTTLWSALLSDVVVSKPHTDAISQYAFYGAMIEGHEQFLGETDLSEDPQEVKSLV